MEIVPASEVAIRDLAAFVAACQARPGSHIGYLGEEAAGITDELTSLEPHGLDGVLVARDAGRILGVLGAEHDHDPPRVWWHGPFADAEDPDATADALYARARGRLPDHVRQEELAADTRNELVASFAHRHGFTAEEASAVLVRPLPAAAHAGTPLDVPSDASIEVVVLDGEQHAAVTALHAATFPGTHTPGGQLARGDDRLVLVAVGPPDRTVCGYVAVEVQRDGTGYLDYLAVASGYRGSGIGGRLVSAACAWLAARGCGTAALTVRESNAAARSLYARLGFEQVRLLRPWRLGFQLDTEVTGAGPG